MRPTLQEATTRLKEAEQYDFCYCMGARDFECIQVLVELAERTLYGR